MRALAEIVATFSPSKMEVAAQCQSKFLYDYVQRLPRRVRADGQFGNAVDAVGNEVYRAKIAALEGAGPQLSAADLERATPTAAAAACIFAAEWDFQGAAVDEWQDDTPAGVLDEGVQLVKRWRDDVAAYVLPRSTQQYLRRTVTDPVTGERFDLSGIVDLQGDTAIAGVVVDLKTSRRSYRADKLARSFQPATYSILAGVPWFEYHVLVRTKEPRPPQVLRVSIPDGERQALVRRAATLRRQIAHAYETGDWLPNRTHTLCSRRYCDRWQVCERDFGGTVPQ